MASFRDIKRNARRDLHEHMQIPALYIVEGEDPLAVNIRLHYDDKALGGVKGTNFSYAEIHEMVPKIIFMRDEVSMPARDAIVSIAEGEAYRIDHALTPDDITVTAEVVRMKPAEMAGLPVPEDA